VSEQWIKSAKHLSRFVSTTLTPTEIIMIAEKIQKSIIEGRMKVTTSSAYMDCWDFV
jgi:hypothetical protein